MVMITTEKFSQRLEVSFRSFRKLDESFRVGNIAPQINATHLHYAFEEHEPLLDALLPTADTFSSKFHGRRKIFLARGHSDAEYKLIPTIFRPPNGVQERKQFDSFMDGYIYGVDIGYETSVFASFLSGLNYSGALLSGESIDLIHSFESFAATEVANILGPIRRQFNVKNYPNEKLLHELSIAQHSGVPTRLLDWTTNPLKALFFACADIDPLPKSDEMRIGIWLFPMDYLEMCEFLGVVKVIRAASFQNTYIARQNGVFTLHNMRHQSQDVWNDVDEEAKKALPLDEYLTGSEDGRSYKDLLKQHIGLPLLLTLPHRAAVRIPSRLKDLDISYSTLMPGPHGAAMEAKRRHRHFRIDYG